MLDSTSPTILKVLPPPAPRITGHLLSRSRQSIEVRAALARRAHRERLPAEELNAAQWARLFRVPRSQIVGRTEHRPAGDALVRLLRRTT
jgi:hypothetical protein